MNKSNELDLRTVIKQPKPVCVSLNDREIYEVRFEVLAHRDPSGSTTRMAVLRSTDGCKTWCSLRLRRNWQRDWWAIIKDGLGGGWWPPSGDYFEDAYIKNDRFTIAYCNLYEHGLQGQAYKWEMQYEPTIDRWNLALLEEIY